MRRREYVAALAAFSAGCPRDTGGGTTDGGTTDDSTARMGESVTTSGGFRVTVSDPVIRSFVVARGVGSSAHADVAGDPDAQFLVVSADVDVTDEAGAVTPAPTRRALGVEVDGNFADGRALRVDDAEHRFALPVPVADVGDAAVVWRTPDGVEARWTLDDGTVDTLGRAPEFVVRSFSVPDSVERRTPVDARLELANEGDRDGTFVAEFGDPTLVSDVGEISVTVSVDERVLRDLTYEPPYWEDVSELQVALDWGYDSRRHSVRVE